MRTREVATALTVLTLALWGSRATVRARDHPAGGSPLPAGWTGVFDSTGHCFFSVPPTWTVSEQWRVDGLARSPDGSTAVAQHWQAASEWSTAVQTLRRQLTPTFVREDTSLRFWFEYAAGWPGTHSVVAQPAESGACVAQIDQRADATAEVRGVIQRVIEGLTAIR